MSGGNLNEVATCADLSNSKSIERESLQWSHLLELVSLAREGDEGEPQPQLPNFESLPLVQVPLAINDTKTMSLLSANLDILRFRERKSTSLPKLLVIANHRGTESAPQ